MSEAKVVNVDFFTRDTLPPRLTTMAEEQSVQLGSDLIMVKTKCSKCCPPSYEFESIGSSPEDIQNLMKKLGKEDGVDLGEAVTRAFGEAVVRGGAQGRVVG